MENNIINQMEAAVSQTIKLLEGFNEKDINISPKAGSWSAAQVGRHLYKSTNGMDDLLYAASKPVDRAPDEKADWLKSIFLDFGKKFDAPEFIVPEDMEYDKDRLIDSLKGVNKKMIDAAKKANLTELAPLFEGHPLLGSTKLELVHFVTYHTMRHNRQIQNIRELV